MKFSLNTNVIPIFTLRLSFYKEYFRNSYKRTPSPELVIDLHQETLFLGLGRYFYIFIKLFFPHSKAIQFRSRFNFKLYKKFGLYGRPLLSLSEFKISRQLHGNSKDQILITDRPVTPQMSQQWKKILAINFESPEPRQMSYPTIYFPCTFHPNVYRCNPTADLEEYLIKYRKSRRPIKIFFGGNARPEKYSGSPIQKNLEIIPRWTALEIIKNRLGPDSIFLKSKNQLKHYLNEGDSSAIIIVRKEDFPERILSSEWLPLLGQCSFFLSLPGVSRPLCHNLIEAMSVGCIPILNYSDFLSPALEDGKNCLIWKTPEELIKKIKQAQAMQPDETQNMRNSVIQYYEDFLDLKKIRRQLDFTQKGVTRIQMDWLNPASKTTLPPLGSAPLLCK